MTEQLVPPRELSDADLVDAIGIAAGRIAALQCRMLLLAAEVDRRRLWATWGMASAAAWLSWRCSLDRVTAREHLRVGHALEHLPLTREAFAAGRLSYSKVRAITRVAGRDDERGWVEVALTGTANHVEALARGYRTAVSSGTARERPGVRWWWDEEGYLVLSARLAPVEGAVLVQALRQAQDALLAAVAPGGPEARGVGAVAGRAAADLVSAAGHGDQQTVDSAGATGCEGEGLVDAVGAADGFDRQPRHETPRPSLADALTLMAHTSLTVGPQPTVGEATGYQVVVHLDEAGARVDGGAALPESATAAVLCDATVTALVTGRDGTVLGVGRRMRRVPEALRRALVERDHGTCRHPGCTNRHWLHAHHVRPWSRGGRTDPDNLVLLCPFHHQLLHDGAFGVEALGSQAFAFLDGQGRPMPESPCTADVPSPQVGLAGLLPTTQPAPGDIAGGWRGDRLDLHYAVSVFAGRRRLLARIARSEPRAGAASQPPRAA